MRCFVLVWRSDDWLILGHGDGNEIVLKLGKLRVLRREEWDVYRTLRRGHCRYLNRTITSSSLSTNSVPNWCIGRGDRGVKSNLGKWWVILWLVIVPGVEFAPAWSNWFTISTKAVNDLHWPFIRQELVKTWEPIVRLWWSFPTIHTVEPRIKGSLEHPKVHLANNSSVHLCPMTPTIRPWSSARLDFPATTRTNHH